MDPLDRKIQNLLQEECSRSLAELGRAVVRGVTFALTWRSSIRTPWDMRPARLCRSRSKARETNRLSSPPP